jgi:hypothetical protein
LGELKSFGDIFSFFLFFLSLKDLYETPDGFFLVVNKTVYDLTIELLISQSISSINLTDYRFV